MDNTANDSAPLSGSSQPGRAKKKGKEGPKKTTRTSKRRRVVEQSPQKPPPLERRRKSQVGGDVLLVTGTTSNTSSPSVLENLGLLASSRTKKRGGGGVEGREAVTTTMGNMVGDNEDDDDNDEVDNDDDESTGGVVVLGTKNDKRRRQLHSSGGAMESTTACIDGLRKTLGWQGQDRDDEDDNSSDDDGESSDDGADIFEKRPTANNGVASNGVANAAAMSSRSLLLHKKDNKKNGTMKSKYVVDRVHGFVKNHLFRKVKFITKQKMLDEVMEVVEETEEGVTDDDVKRMAFRKMYKSSVMEALNARRSSCDQMGCKIVNRYLSENWKPGTVPEGKDDEDIPSFLSIETLSKLRRSATEEEMAAFSWFFSEFMECISGKRAWGKQKYTQLISEASSLDNGEKLLTVSDEAFGLFLVENYMHKWVKKFHIQQKGQPMGRLDGVYTAATKGNLVFGGWTKQGRNRFNYYCKLVQEDRSSARSVEVEKIFLLVMQGTPEGQKIQARLLKRSARYSNNDDDNESEEEIYYEKLVYINL